MQVQWGSKIWSFEIWTSWMLDFKWVRFQMVRFSNGQALAMAPTIQNPDFFCPDFKWLDFWISDPIRNPNHMKPILFFDHSKSRLAVLISEPHCILCWVCIGDKLDVCTGSNCWYFHMVNSVTYMLSLRSLLF